MFKNSNFQHLWPLKLLRFMVSILVTGKRDGVFDTARVCRGNDSYCVQRDLCQPSASWSLRCPVPKCKHTTVTTLSVGVPIVSFLWY